MASEDLGQLRSWRHLPTNMCDSVRRCSSRPTVAAKCSNHSGTAPGRHQSQEHVVRNEGLSCPMCARRTGKPRRIRVRNWASDEAPLWTCRQVRTPIGGRSPRDSQAHCAAGTAPREATGQPLLAGPEVGRRLEGATLSAGVNATTNRSIQLTNRELRWSTRLSGPGPCPPRSGH